MICNLKAYSKASLIHILNVRISDIFFHNHLLNPVKISGIIINPTIILSVDN